MLPFQPPCGALEAVTLDPAETTAIENLLRGRLDRYRAHAPGALCKRDGHRPVARWRGQALRCWRCTRCGEERQP